MWGGERTPRKEPSVETSPEKIQARIKLNIPGDKSSSYTSNQKLQKWEDINSKWDCCPNASGGLPVTVLQSSKHTHSRWPFLEQVHLFDMEAPLAATFCNKNQSSKNSPVSLKEKKKRKSSKTKLRPTSKVHFLCDFRTNSCWFQTWEKHRFAICDYWK